MRSLKGRGRARAAVAVLGLAGATGLLAASAANAADFPNACKNSVTANQSQIGVTMTATSPTSVAPGGPVALTNIQQTVSVPGGIFVAGYNLGVLTAGPNTIPTTVATLIEGTNTVEGTQSTNTASTSISTTISDPDGNPGTGDETATDGTLSVTYNDQTWTAGGSPGTIDFREDTVPIGAGAGALHTGGREDHRHDRRRYQCAVRLQPRHRGRTGSGRGHARRPGRLVRDHTGGRGR